jgi:hypothetical protein
MTVDNQTDVSTSIVCSALDRNNTMVICCTNNSLFYFNIDRSAIFASVDSRVKARRQYLAYPSRIYFEDVAGALMILYKQGLVLQRDSPNEESHARLTAACCVSDYTIYFKDTWTYAHADYIKLDDGTRIYNIYYHYTVSKNNINHFNDRKYRGSDIVKYDTCRFGPDNMEISPDRTLLIFDIDSNLIKFYNIESNVQDNHHLISNIRTKGNIIDMKFENANAIIVLTTSELIRLSIPKNRKKMSEFYTDTLQRFDERPVGMATDVASGNYLISFYNSVRWYNDTNGLVKTFNYPGKKIESSYIVNIKPRFKDDKYNRIIVVTNDEKSIIPVVDCDSTYGVPIKPGERIRKPKFYKE